MVEFLKIKINKFILILRHTEKKYEKNIVVATIIEKCHIIVRYMIVITIFIVDITIFPCCHHIVVAKTINIDNTTIILTILWLFSSLRI